MLVQVSSGIPITRVSQSRAANVCFALFTGWMIGLRSELGKAGVRGQKPKVEKCSFQKWSEVAQSCPTLCDPMDCRLPGSSIHGIFQARVLEWVAISFSRGSSQPRDQTQVSSTGDRCFTIWATQEALSTQVPHVQLRRGACCDMRMLWTSAFSAGDPRLSVLQHRMFKVTTSWLDLTDSRVGWGFPPVGLSSASQAVHKQVLGARRLSLGKLNGLKPALWAEVGVSTVWSPASLLRTLLGSSLKLPCSQKPLVPASLHIAWFSTVCSIKIPLLGKIPGSINFCEGRSVQQMRRMQLALNRGPQGRLCSPSKEEWC